MNMNKSQSMFLYLTSNKLFLVLSCCGTLLLLTGVSGAGAGVGLGLRGLVLVLALFLTTNLGVSTTEVTAALLTGLFLTSHCGIRNA